MNKQEDMWDKLYEKGLTWKKTNKIDENLKDKLVLELGVGNGKTLKSILEKKPKPITAIDISKEAINLAKKSIDSDKVSYIIKDFLKFNTKNKFDIIVCYYFLNNFKENARKEAASKMKSLLKKNGIILFEDFGVGDCRQKGKEIEKNTIEKENGIICHFFEKDELKELFKEFDIKIEQKTFNPIRNNKRIKRKIIKAKIRTR